MSYAANLGRDQIIRLLHELGAKDHGHAIDRATLQGRIGTARMLHAMMGAPRLPDDALEGPAYTLSATGTALVFDLGGRAVDEHGKRIAPVATVLGTDSRKPAEKHAILEMYVAHGLDLPDTPPKPFTGDASICSMPTSSATPPSSVARSRTPTSSLQSSAAETRQPSARLSTAPRCCTWLSTTTN